MVEGPTAAVSWPTEIAMMIEDLFAAEADFLLG